MALRAYYNECDPICAQWLRNLIGEGLITDGEVDERSIVDVQPEDLVGFDRVHFFAGVSAWDLALNRAGWPDDRPIWTGSCPCQPFSLAGAGRGFDDPRHLWPHWFRLIAQRRPHTILGEQVASAGAWLDLVQADLEDRDYAFGKVDLPAAGFSGAHIRQRFYWVADASFAGSGRYDRAVLGEKTESARERIEPRHQLNQPKPYSVPSRMADSDDAQRRADLAGGHVLDGGAAGRFEGDGEPGAGGDVGGLEHANRSEQGAQRRDNGEMRGLQEAQRQSGHGAALPGRGSATGGLGIAPSGGWERLGNQSAFRVAVQAGPFDSWLFCRDGKLRPVESGSFPLAPTSPGRVGRLRAYGNSLDVETATQFVSAYMDCCP